MNRILLAAMLLCSTSLFAQSWEQLGNAPASRHHPISFSLDGKGYAVTGSLSNGQPTDEAYQYDPITDTWTTLTDFPGLARSYGIGVVTNGIAYLGFGATNTQYLRDLWSFDAFTQTWTQLANCSCLGRRHPAMIATNTKIYVGMGDNASGDQNDWWMYDIALNSWTQLADMPGPERHHPFMFNTGGELFAGLGHSGNIIYNDWYKLDTITNTWNEMNDFPGEARVAGTQFNMNGYGFLLSGDGDNHDYMATGEMWRYDPSDDTWMELTAHPGESRWAPGSFVIENDIYFFGGLNRLTSQFPNDMWKYAMPAPPPVDPVDTVGTSINEQALANTFVYPNPANNIILWKHDSNITNVKVFNTLGQLLMSSVAEAKQLDTKDLNEGIYLVQFYENETPVKTARVLIKH
jgi:N-acetylneuraminic acid mutarotase